MEAGNRVKTLNILNVDALIGIGTALVTPLFTIPMTSTVFDLIGKDEESAEHRVEYVVFRELGLNIGRMTGTALFVFVMAFQPGPAVLTWFVFILGCSPLLAAIFMRRVLKNQRQANQS